MARQKTDIDYDSNITSAHMADALVSPFKDDSISITLVYGLENKVGNSGFSDTGMEKQSGNINALRLTFKDDEDEIHCLHSEAGLGKPQGIEKHTVLALEDVCDEGTETTEGQILLERVKTGVGADEEQHFQDSGDVYTEGHSRRAKANEKYCQEEDPPDAGGICNWRTVGNVQLEPAAGCAEFASHKSNTEYLDTDATNKDLTVQRVDSNRADVTIDMATNFTDDVPYEDPTKVSSVDARNTDGGYMYSKYRTDLSVKKAAQVLVNEAGSSNRVLYEVGRKDEKLKKKRAVTVDTELASSDEGPADMTPDSCSQFFVECENGIKLYVDLKTKTPVDWMKTQSYEFCLSEQLNEQNLYAQTPKLKVTEGLNISEDTNTVADKKIESAKLTESHVMDGGNTATLLSIAGDCHLATSSRAGRVAFTSPQKITKKFEASRELRRTSSVLIPPHGANRCLSPLMSHGVSRLSSPLISHGAKKFLLRSSEVGCRRPHTYNNQQIAQGNLSSEQYMPVMALPSKVVEEISVWSRAQDKELLTERKHSCLTKVEAMSETAVPYSQTKAEAANCCSMDDAELEDVEMVDHELCTISDMKASNSGPQEQQGACSQEEDGQNKERDMGRIMQFKNPVENSKREMDCFSLMEEFEAKEQNFISRYKYDYKKSPFVKNLRRMKNLARVSSMRADILAYKRSTPCMVFAHPDPSCLIDHVHSGLQTAEEKKCASESILRERCEEVAHGNAHAVLFSPIVYQERDLCGSALSHLEASQNHGSIPMSARVGQMEGNSKSNQSKQKLQGWPFLGFGRRRFLQRALADSAKRLKAQKMLRSGVYDRLVTQEEVTEEFLSQKKTDFSLKPNDSNLNMFESEQDLYSERMTDKQRRHHEQFKTPLIGKSREKAKKIAKKMAVFHRGEIVRSKRGIILTHLSDTDVQDNSDYPFREVSIDMLHQICNIGNREVKLI